MSSPAGSEPSNDDIKHCQFIASIDKFVTSISAHHMSLINYAKANNPESVSELFDNMYRLWPDHPIFAAGYPEPDDLDKIDDDITRRDNLWQEERGDSYNEKRFNFRMSLMEALIKQRGLPFDSLQNLTYVPHRKPDEPALSLVQLAADTACRRLKDLIESRVFVCSGTIDICKTRQPSHQTSPPVNIFWSAKEARQLVLPRNDAGNLNSNVVHGIGMDCSFDRPHENIRDPSACWLDPEQFATSFHPADFGIMEKVHNMLVPSVQTDITGCRKVVADLHKLHVLSADCPNMNLVPPSDQDGWLGWLVCLPSPFEGGNMKISLNGQTAVFQWCSTSCSTIQWVAFTHDCKQRVEAVEKGQLISLIYRVYLNEWQVRRLPTSQLDPLSSYEYMRHLFSLPIFIGEGGVLGLFCSEPYPHASDAADSHLLQALKGRDLLVLSMFESLGCKVDILPVIEKDGCYLTQRADLESERDFSGDRNRKEPFKNLCAVYGKLARNGFEDCNDIDGRSKNLIREMKTMRKRAVTGLPKCDVARVGKELHPYRVVSYESGPWDRDEDEVVWSFDEIPGVYWVNEPKHETLAVTHIRGGKIEERKSCLAMFVLVPRWVKRASGCKKGKRKRSDAGSDDSERPKNISEPATLRPSEQAQH